MVCPLITPYDEMLQAWSKALDRDQLRVPHSSWKDMDDRHPPLGDRCTCVDRARNGKFVYDMANQKSYIPQMPSQVQEMSVHPRKVHKQEIRAMGQRSAY